MEKIKAVLEALRNDLHHVPMTDRLASAFRHLDAALSALEGSQPKELTDEEIERVTSSRYPDKDLSALSGQIARWKREAMAISLRHARDHGHLSPQPSEELAASLPVSEGLQARLDRANRLLIQQKEQHPKEQGAEPYAWTVSGTRQMYFGEYAESDARMEAKKIGGTAVAFPLFRQEQGAEPVAWMTEDGKEFVENWVREKWVKDNGPTSQFFIPRYPTPLYRHPQPLPTPTSREKAMEEAGDAMLSAINSHIIRIPTGHPPLGTEEVMIRAAKRWTPAKSTK